MKKISIPTFVKWAGGKSQLLSQYEKYFPKNIKRYFEPFVGGGAVFFYIKKTQNPESCMISDCNKHLINLYQVVRDDVDSLIENLVSYQSEHMDAMAGFKLIVEKAKRQKDKKPKFEYYYKKRTEYNSIKKINTKEKKIIKSSLLIYLNKTCYNGLYRVNSSGDFNVPVGKNDNPSILQKNQLKEASKLLSDVEIKNMRYNQIKKYVKKGDFVYFDPPYDPLSQTSSFTSYQKKGFTQRQQSQLSNLFKKLDKKGCTLMLSNSNTPLIHSLYNRYEKKETIFSVKAKRMISCNGLGRKPVNEVVITNYKPLFIQKKILKF